MALPAEVRTLVARVTQGMTLSSLLRTHDVAEHDIVALVARVAAVFDVTSLRVDRPYRIVQALSGPLRRFEYDIDSDRRLRVVRGESDQFEVAVDPIQKRTEQVVVEGSIDRDASSLFAAMARAGEQMALTIALADVLGSEVDFNTELQPGDRFRVLVEKRFPIEDATERPVGTSGLVGAVDDEGTPIDYGTIDGVELVNAGRTIRAVRFTPSGGTPDYFDEQGRSLRRFFLKSPLKFDPIITSRFSSHRRHPVLGFTRAHLGVDYRAATGAPVVAVADGVVVSAGRNRGAGRLIHLRHANGLETQYLHLSAQKVRAGQRVRQGDVIGLVGATGLVTGPHLDYRVRKNGAFVNPVDIHAAMPPGDPVPAEDRSTFEAARNRTFAALAIPAPLPSP